MKTYVSTLFFSKPEGIEVVDLENLHVDTFRDHRAENDKYMPYIALSSYGCLTKYVLQSSEYILQII